MNEYKKIIEELEKKHFNECRQIAQYDNESKLFADIGKMYSEIKAEAVKDFAKSIKSKLNDLSRVYLYDKTYYLVGEEFVDNAVRKFEGETEI